MLSSVFVVWLARLTLVMGECWNAKFHHGVRCKDIFKSSKTSMDIKCFMDCLATSRCCSVNYVLGNKTCEFCTASPAIEMVYDGSYSYIGYTTRQIQTQRYSTIHCTLVDVTEEACFDKKEEFNKSISILTNGGTCEQWNEPGAHLSYFPDSYFVADEMSKTRAKNYCRHPKLEGSALRDSAPFLYCLAADPFIDKAMCAVRSCHSTNLTQCGTPPALQAPAVRSFPVVGDVYLAYYRCTSISGGSIPASHCPVSRCVGTNSWTKPTFSCSASDCYPTGQVTSYEGKRMCTESGRTCQAWALNYPHSHTYENLRNDPSNGNYCRGTAGSKPWCYTTDPELRWEVCGVPEC